MNTQLQNFEFNTHQLNVVIDDAGEPWFIAKQVADILGYSDAEAMTRKLDDDEVQNLQIVGFGNRGVNVISESGLYSAILTSKKPAAKAFKRWVTAEVLPSIRKTGGYAPELTVNARAFETLQAKYIALLEQENDRLKTAPSAADVPFGTLRLWTADEDRLLLTLHAQGLGHTRIGFKLGRGGNSVRHRLARLARAGITSVAQVANQNDLFGGTQ